MELIYLDDDILVCLKPPRVLSTDEPGGVPDLAREALGNPKMARAVGNILHKNPQPDRYPCYKVVNAKGKLATNFAFGGEEGQRKRLEAEGIAVVDNTVDLRQYLWREE